MKPIDEFARQLRRSRAARIAGRARRKQFPFVPPPIAKEPKTRGVR